MITLILTPYFCMIYFNIILPSPPRWYKLSLCKNVYAFLIAPLCATSPAHLMCYTDEQYWRFEVIISLSPKSFAVFLTGWSAQRQEKSVGVGVGVVTCVCVSYKQMCLLYTQQSTRVCSWNLFFICTSPMYRVTNFSNWYCHCFNEDDYRTDFSFF
jgi:hypothetical protein